VYTNIAKWWLVGFLIFLPFQRKIIKSIVSYSSELSKFISYLDELTIIIFLPLSLIKLYKLREFPDRLCLILLFSILVLCVSGFMSGVVNGNSLLVTTLGTFDYVKNFLVVFVYAAFFRDFREFKGIFKLLLILTVLLGVIAFIQELLALAVRYIIENDISDSLRNDNWRFGFYRTPSLIGNPNMLGLYSLLILTIYLFMSKKINYAIFIPISVGIFASISRMVYTGLIFVTVIQILRGKKRFIVLAVILTAILAFYMPALKDITFIDTNNEFSGKISFREYARDNAIDIWVNNPFWGVGPGIFGGVVSVKYNSFIYEEYNFSSDAVSFIRNVKSIDQFWPQILAETGIAGTAAFLGIFMALFLTLFTLRQQATFSEVKGLFAGLMVFTIVILIYTMGSGLNITSIIFTYSALVGMGVGSCRNSKYRSYIRNR